MATRKKRFVRSKNAEYDADAAVYANFMADLLSGSVTATGLTESRDGRGRLLLDYDDPNG